ncbi:MAG: hypothetical protein IKE24_08255 [Clostridia bacterium]|nr:hypothetical protein [Clostridia bacterium]
MKKWLVALVLTLAVCILAGVTAYADNPTVTVNVANGTQLNGTWSGSYYYKVYVSVSGGSNSIECGWNTDINASAPDGSWTEDISQLFSDNVGAYFVTTPDENVEGYQDAFYVRAPGASGWTKTVFSYDQSRVADMPGLTITNEAGPSLLEPYTVQWSDVKGADHYGLRWKMPNTYEWGFGSTANSLRIDGEMADHNLANKTGYVGTYVAWVEAYANGTKYTGETKSFTISAPGADDAFVLRAEGAEDGELTIGLHEHVHYQIFAPAEAGHVFFVCGEWPDDHVELDENGYAEYDWNAERDNYEDSYTYTAYAMYQTENGPVYSNTVQVTVTIDENTVVGTPDNFTIVNENNTIARDGLLEVQIENVPNGDFYEAFVEGEGEWVAHSGWYDRENGDSTTVYLPVNTLEPGEYELHVYSARYGSRHAHSTQTKTFTVAEASEEAGDIIFGMQNSFTTGEPIRIRAYYPNPNELDNAWMHVEIHRRSVDGDEYYSRGDGLNFQDDGYCIWEEDQYFLTATVFHWIDEENDQKEVIASATHEFYVDATDMLEPPTISSPSTVIKGNDLIVRITAPGAEYVDLDMQHVTDGNWYDVGGWSCDLDENGETSFPFDKDLFEYAGGVYRIAVHSRKYGWDSGHSEIRVAVVGGEANTDQIALYVNGEIPENDDLEVLSRQNIRVKVAAPDAGAVKVLNGDHWEYWWGDDNYERDWSFGDDVVLVAMATYDHDAEYFAWLDENKWQVDDGEGGTRYFDWNTDCSWTAVSNSVKLVVTSPYGELDAPSFTLSGLDNNDAIAWGGKVTVQVTDDNITQNSGETIIDNAWYYTYLEQLIVYEDGHSGWERVELPFNIEFIDGTAQIPTFALDGEAYYRVWVGADGEGYQANESGPQQFYVGVRDESEGVFKEFYVTNTEITTQTQIRLIGYHSGAEWIEVEIRKEGDPGWRDHRSSDGDTLYQEWGTGHSGTYNLTATAYGHLYDENNERIEDENGEEAIWSSRIGIVTVYVNVEEGRDLSEPVLNSIPSVVHLGEAINGSFEPVENAQFYHVQIHYCRENADWDDIEYREFEASENMDRSISLTSEQLNETGRYRIEVYAGAFGYNDVSIEKYIQVVKATTAEQISLTVNGELQSAEARAGESLDIRVTAPGATAIRIMKDHGNWEWWDGRALDGNGVLHWNPSFESGNYTFYAQASYDENEDGEPIDWDHFDGWDNFNPNTDLDWTAGSNMVSVTLTADGHADPAVISEIAPVTRGELVTVEVTSAGGDQSASRATNLYAVLMNDDGYETGNGIGAADIAADDYPVTFRFPTGALEAGTYYAWVHSSAPGYNSTGTYIAFDVLEPEEEEVPFIFEVQDGIIDHQNFSMSGYEANTSWFEVVIDNINDDEDPFIWGPFDGNHIYSTEGKLDEGDYDIYAVAHYVDEEGRETGTRRSETFQRIVTVLGDLNEPVINAEEVYSINEGISFTVDDLGQGDWWWVAVRDMDQTFVNENGDDEWVTVAEWDARDDKPELFVIAGGALTPGHRYNIEANVSQSGYHGGHSWKNILVIEGAGNLRLTVDVPNGYDLNNWPSSKNLSINVSAPGSSAVRVWGNGNWDCRDGRNMEGNGNNHFDFNFNDEGSYTLVAQAAYEEVNWDGVDWSHFSWDDMEWSATSNQVTVTIAADGQLAEPVYSMIPAAKPGTDLVIRIPNPIQDQWYGGVIYFEDGSELIEYTGMDEDTNTITLHIPDDVEPGNYRAWVWTDAEGKLGQGVSIPMVIDNLQEASTFKLPANLSAVEEEAFDGVHMDVVVIQGNHPNLDLSFILGTGAKYVVADGPITLPRGCSVTVISTAQYNVIK